MVEVENAQKELDVWGSSFPGDCLFLFLYLREVKLFVPGHRLWRGFKHLSVSSATRERSVMLGNVACWVRIIEHKKPPSGIVWGSCFKVKGGKLRSVQAPQPQVRLRICCLKEVMWGSRKTLKLDFESLSCSCQIGDLGQVFYPNCTFLSENGDGDASWQGYCWISAITHTKCSEWCQHVETAQYHFVEDCKYPPGVKKKSRCYLSMDLLQSFLSDAHTAVYGKWLGTVVREAIPRGGVPFSNSSLTFRPPYPLWWWVFLWLEIQRPRSTWVDDKACPAHSSPSWAIPEVLPGQTRTRQGSPAAVFVLIADWNVSQWQAARKSPCSVPAPSPFSNTVRLASWAAQALPRVEEQHSPGWEVPPGFGPRRVVLELTLSYKERRNPKKQ